jgi:prophage antirepressor-like protein
MNNQLQVFENEEFGKVRVLEIDGQPWFVGKDVTDILGYGNGSRDINRHVDAEIAGTTETVHPKSITAALPSSVNPACTP